MDTQSQITKSGHYYKVCNSCQRNLNFSYFGMLRNSKNGFNSTCKTCRKQAQKKHFAKSYKRTRPLRAQPPEFIASLDQQNGAVLAKRLPSETAVELAGISVTTGTPCKALVETVGRDPNRSLQFQLWIDGDERPFTVMAATRNVERFIQYCLVILREQSVRLHSIEELSRAESVFLSELEPIQQPGQNWEQMSSKVLFFRKQLKRQTF